MDTENSKRFDKLKKWAKEHYIISILIAIAIVRLFIYLWYLGNGFFPVGTYLSKSDWLAFSSSFIGGLIGATITIIGVFLTLKSNESIFSQTLTQQATQHKDALNEIAKEQEMRSLPVFDMVCIDGDGLTRDFKGSYKSIELIESITDVRNQTYTRLAIINQGNGVGKIKKMIINYHAKTNEDHDITVVGGKMIIPGNAIILKINKELLFKSRKLIFNIETIGSGDYIQEIHIAEHQCDGYRFESDMPFSNKSTD